MRIDIPENSGRRLRLTLATNVALYAVFGLMFVGLGAWCIRALALETRVAVEAQRFTSTTTCVWIIDCGSVDAAVQDVRGISVVGGGLQVELADGAHQIELPGSDDAARTGIARGIQSALSVPGKSYQHTEGGPLAALLLGLVCIASGVLIGAAIQRVSVIADRDAGTLQVTRRLLLLPIRRSYRMDLAHVDDAQAVPHTLETFRHVVTSYSVCLQVRGSEGAESIGLTFLPMFTERAAMNLAGILRDWIRPGRQSADCDVT